MPVSSPCDAPASEMAQYATGEEHSTYYKFLHGSTTCLKFKNPVTGFRPVPGLDLILNPCVTLHEVLHNAQACVCSLIPQISTLAFEGSPQLKCSRLNFAPVMSEGVSMKRCDHLASGSARYARSTDPGRDPDVLKPVHSNLKHQSMCWNCTSKIALLGELKV